MRKLILLCTSLCAMVLLFSVQPVMAQSVLWVGPNGNDGNACSQTSPCATFQGAINKGSVSQINCLGSGNYGNGGQLTIVASITIDCGTGNVGTISITGNGNAAILIQANSSSPTTIILRHLSLNGNGDGS